MFKLSKEKKELLINLILSVIMIAVFNLIFCLLTLVWLVSTNALERLEAYSKLQLVSEVFGFGLLLGMFLVSVGVLIFFFKPKK